MNRLLQFAIGALLMVANVGCSIPPNKPVPPAPVRALVAFQNQAEPATVLPPPVTELRLPALRFDHPVAKCQLFSAATAKGPWTHVDDLEECPDGTLRVWPQGESMRFFVMKEVQP